MSAPGSLLSATHQETGTNQINARPSGSEDALYAAIPLKYTYLIRSRENGYLYESNIGLWKELDPENGYILSQISPSPAANYRIIDNYSVLKSKLIDPNYEQLAVVDTRMGENLLHFKVHSQKNTETIKEHARILANYQKFDFKTLLVDRGKFKSILSYNSMAPEFKNSLDELSKFCGVEILISNRIEYFNLALPQEVGLGDQNIYIYILGDLDDTTFAESRLRILLDNYLDLFIDSIEIPVSLIPLVGGVSFGDFRAVAKETGVNIYLPSILPELYQNSAKHHLDTMYLSGMEAQVLLAKKFILDIVEKRKNETYYKNINILKFKKDLLLMNHGNEITSIMYKHGVFVQLPPLGVDESTVHFQGSTPELVERAIADFTLLINETFFANIWFHKASNSTDDHYDPAELKISNAELQELVGRISIASNVSIYTNPTATSFELWGSQADTLKAIKLFNSYSKQQLFEDGFKPSIVFKIELGLSYHEFISGKKNGKISKIMNNFKTSTINFEPLNEYSLLVELKSIDFNDFLKSYEQLQNEFPSEVKFYIPEAFHRQIIGTGGSLIQSIMRKYNVFIKFSNSYDLKNNYKSPIRYDNVIIRCPAKNSSNIPLVKTELSNLLINNENTTFFNTFLKISRNQYRLLDFDKIQQIEKKTSTFVRFPTSEPNDYALVEILGTENHSINATKLFANELAESYEFKITFSKNFHSTINDTNNSYVEKIKLPFKVLYNFEVMGVDRKTEDSVPYHSIILSYPTESDLFLEDAITHLTSFLRENEFMIIDRGELSNNDSMVHGSATRLAQMNQNFNNGNKMNGNNNKPHTANSFDTNNYSKYPFVQQMNVPVQLPQSQQLYHLPNFQERVLVTQPTLVQPLGVQVNKQRMSYSQQQQQQAMKKRPATHSGYDNAHMNNKTTFYTKRPY